MTLTTALSLARDFAALATASLLVLTAAAAATGAGGVVAGGLAATVATIAASGLATLALFGLVNLFVETPFMALLIAIGAFALAGGFAAAQIYGVRGLWIVALAVLGALLAAVILWTLMRHMGRPIGPVAPLAAGAALALIAFGSLSAALRAETVGPKAVAEPAGLWRAAQARFATPPSWFDCAYATMGGQAVRPGFCAFRPPRAVVEAPGAEGASPSLSAPESAPGPSIAETEDPSALKAPVSDVAAAGPASAPSPAAPSAETPDFAPLRRGEAAAPSQPDRLGPAPRETAPAEGVDAGGAVAGAEAPQIPDAPAAAAGAPTPNEAPEPIARPDAARVRVAAADSSPKPPSADAPPSRAADPRERKRTEFLCFPMPGGLADQLCPDDRLTPRDLAVRWRGGGGEGDAAVDQVECFREPGMTLHATLVADLSGAMIASIPTAQGPASRMRKVDAVYEMITRLIVEARALSETSAPGEAPSLRLSAYVAGGSRLLSPWASQQFGEDRVDRLFDVRSTRQTLALVRRLQSEGKSLRRASLGRDLVETLAAVILERPSDPEPPSQGLVLAAIDRSAAEAVEPDRLAPLGERFRAARLPLYVVEVGSEEPNEALRRMAEATGGGAFAANDGASLADIADRVLMRTRSFCAVRITAPESFFDGSGLEVRLRRDLLDGCRFEQIATLSCEGLSMTDRIIQPSR